MTYLSLFEDEVRPGVAFNRPRFVIHSGAGFLYGRLLNIYCLKLYTVVRVVMNISQFNSNGHNPHGLSQITWSKLITISKNEGCTCDGGHHSRSNIVFE